MTQGGPIDPQKSLASEGAKATVQSRAVVSMRGPSAADRRHNRGTLPGLFSGSFPGAPRSRKSETGIFRGSIPSNSPPSAEYGEGSRKPALRWPVLDRLLVEAFCGELECRVEK